MRLAAMRESSSTASRLALPALLLANCSLACAPWLVRLSETQAHVGPIGSAFWRMALSLPFLIAARPVAREKLPERPFPFVAAAAFGGALFAAQLAAWYAGILHTRMSNATLFGNLAAILFPIYGFIAARSWPRPRQWLALGLAIAGTAILLGRSYELTAGNLLGDILSIAAGICYSLYLFAVDRARRMLGPLTALTITVAAAAPAAFLIARAFHDPIVPADWTPVILMAISCQLVGQGLILWSVGRASALLVGLMLLVQPIVAACIGMAVYGESITLADLVGAAGIAAAILLVREKALPPARERVV